MLEGISTPLSVKELRKKVDLREAAVQDTGKRSISRSIEEKVATMKTKAIAEAKA